MGSQCEHEWRYYAGLVDSCGKCGEQRWLLEEGYPADGREARLTAEELARLEKLAK